MARGRSRGEVKRLLLLRHAHAAEGTPDAERPLDERGRAEAARIGPRIAALGRPELALCSSARRARETFEAARRALSPAPELRLEDALYLAPAERLLESLSELDGSLARILLVAHNPGLEALARGLASGGAPEALERLRRGLPPAGLAVLDLDLADWSDVPDARGLLVACERP
jgi:phosphohistidine phosphatase